jgi:hypothetical protein
LLNAQVLSPNTNLTAREEQIIAAASWGKLEVPASVFVLAVIIAGYLYFRG